MNTARSTLSYIQQRQQDSGAMETFQTAKIRDSVLQFVSAPDGFPKLKNELAEICKKPWLYVDNIFLMNWFTLLDRAKALPRKHIARVEILRTLNVDLNRATRAVSSATLAKSAVVEEQRGPTFDSVMLRTRGLVAGIFADTNYK